LFFVSFFESEDLPREVYLPKKRRESMTSSSSTLPLLKRVTKFPNDQPFQWTVEFETSDMSKKTPDMVPPDDVDVILYQEAHSGARIYWISVYQYMKLCGQSDPDCERESKLKEGEGGKLPMRRLFRIVDDNNNEKESVLNCVPLCCTWNIEYAAPLRSVKRKSISRDVRKIVCELEGVQAIKDSGVTTGNMSGGGGGGSIMAATVKPSKSNKKRKMDVPPIHTTTTAAVMSTTATTTTTTAVIPFRAEDFIPPVVVKTEPKEEEKENQTSSKPAATAIPVIKKEPDGGGGEEEEEDDDGNVIWISSSHTSLQKPLYQDGLLLPSTSLVHTQQQQQQLQPEDEEELPNLPSGLLLKDQKLVQRIDWRSPSLIAEQEAKARAERAAKTPEPKITYAKAPVDIKRETAMNRKKIRAQNEHDRERQWKMIIGEPDDGCE
jgi:hypothetical protein